MRAAARLASAAPRRRLLMIARDYLPINTPGTLRAVGFTRHLPEFGWTTSVVTMRRPRPVGVPAELAPAPDTTVYGAFGFDTKNAFSLFGRYPQILAIPDRNVSWLPAGVAGAMRAVRENGVDAILSTGPPQTAHCIANLVQRMTGLPWVADVRDLWDEPPAHARSSRALERRLARHLLRSCDRLTVVTREIADGLMRSYAVDLGERAHLLSNGFDEDDFAGLDAPAAARFTIAHVGFVSGHYRNPTSFFTALRACLDRGELPRDTIVSFPGADGETLRPLSSAAGVAEIVRARPRVGHSAALREMCSASVLLLLQGEEFRHAVPTKAYEYLRSGRPIVAPVALDGEVARLLRPFDGVFLAGPDDTEQIAQRLVEAYRSWRDGRAVDRPAAQLAPYTRRAAAGELARILDGTRSAPP